MVEKLNLADKSVTDVYMHGFCSHLALHAKRYTNHKIVAIIETVWGKNYLVHCGVLLPDGTIVDAENSYANKKEFLAKVKELFVGDKDSDSSGFYIMKEPETLEFVSKTESEIGKVSEHFDREDIIDFKYIFLNYINANYKKRQTSGFSKVVANQNYFDKLYPEKHTKMLERNNSYLRKLYVSNENYKYVTDSSLGLGVGCIWITLNTNMFLVITPTTATILKNDVFSKVYILHQDTVTQCVENLARVITKYKLDPQLLEFPKNMSLRYKQV